MASVRRLLFFLFVATLFVGCDNINPSGGSGGDTPSLPDIKPFLKGDTVSRTLLVYMMAENSLTNDLLDDFSEIKRAAEKLDNNSRLFVYFDNSDTTRLPALYQYLSYEGELIENAVYTFEDDVCSSDTTVLAKVLNLILDDYPTQAFDLIMGSHADGWVHHKANASPNRVIGIDNGKNTYSNNITTTIEIDELATVLRDNLPMKIDRLMFDACLMQGVEVAYALRNVADWIIASPAEIPANGAPYDYIIPEFFNSESGVDDIMYEYKRAYDNEYYAVVLSAVRASYMQDLADSTRVYVKKYFDVDSVNDYSVSLAYVPNKAPAYYDVSSVMNELLDSVDYNRWKVVFDKAVPYVMVSNSKKVWSNIARDLVEVADSCSYGAVSAYFPQDKFLNLELNKDFRTTEWYVAAGWKDAGW